MPLNTAMVAHRRLRLRIEAARRADGIGRAVGESFRHAREDAGLPQRKVAEVAGVSSSHYAEIEIGSAHPSLEAMAAISLALGGELSVRFHSGTGPRIRDRIQAAMVEAVLRVLDPRWAHFVEVPVYRPAVGVIDLVLAERATDLLVAAEFHSQLRRLEQQIRWARGKADSLPSTSIGELSRRTAVDRLLVLRSTRETRALAVDFAKTLSSAYPARTSEIVEALRGEARWPGSGIAWVHRDGNRTHLMDGPPRGVRLGR
jgi:DNA-binding XRE family transcriptional regulator